MAIYSLIGKLKISVAKEAIDDFLDFFAPHPHVDINSIPGYTFVEKPNHSSLEEMAESFNIRPSNL
ncbi:MAG: hypothetical protein HDR44_01465 [Allobaculum sp.]|nr:hypothetical protein [Allobaculum sp.]